MSYHGSRDWCLTGFAGTLLVELALSLFHWLFKDKTDIIVPKEICVGAHTVSAVKIQMTNVQNRHRHTGTYTHTHRHTHNLQYTDCHPPLNCSLLGMNMTGPCAFPRSLFLGTGDIASLCWNVLQCAPCTNGTEFQGVSKLQRKRVCDSGMLWAWLTVGSDWWDLSIDYRGLKSPRKLLNFVMKSYWLIYPTRKQPAGPLSPQENCMLTLEKRQTQLCKTNRE